MWEFLRDTVEQIVRGFGDRLAAFGPNVLAMILILLVGVLVAAATSFVLRRLLPRIGFDVFAEKIGLANLLRKGNVAAPPSVILTLTTGWTLFAVFALLAISALDLQFAMDFVSRAFAYLPQLLIAAMLLAVGSLVSGFLRRSVLIAAVNAGVPSARLLASGVQTVVMVLFIAMAAEHLGVGRQILLSSFTILFGGVVFALSLAFGLAGRHMAREFLDRLRRRSDDAEKDDIRHL
ncbi:MAG: mechanosensitive ion channel family protein [Vicinamibacteria bacterium]